MEQGIDAKRTATLATKNGYKRWKRLEAFYSELISDLRAVQKAWRNPDAHFRRPFTEAQALKVLERVRDFMQNLATRISERRS